MARVFEETAAMASPSLQTGRDVTVLIALWVGRTNAREQRQMHTDTDTGIDRYRHTTQAQALTQITHNHADTTTQTHTHVHWSHFKPVLVDRCLSQLRHLWTVRRMSSSYLLFRPT